MRKYYIKRNRIESTIELIGEVVELAAIREDNLGIIQATQLRDDVIARLKDIFLEEIEEEED